MEAHARNTGRRVVSVPLTVHTASIHKSKITRPACRSTTASQSKDRAPAAETQRLAAAPFITSDPRPVSGRKTHTHTRTHENTLGHLVNELKKKNTPSVLYKRTKVFLTDNYHFCLSPCLPPGMPPIYLTFFSHSSHSGAPSAPPELSLSQSCLS